MTTHTEAQGPVHSTMASNEINMSNTMHYLISHTMQAMIWAFALFIVLHIVHCTRQTFRSHLWLIPDPLTAQLSTFYRPWKVSGENNLEFYHKYIGGMA